MRIRAHMDRLLADVLMIIPVCFIPTTPKAPSTPWNFGSYWRSILNGPCTRNETGLFIPNIPYLPLTDLIISRYYVRMIIVIIVEGSFHSPFESVTSVKTVPVTYSFSFHSKIFLFVCILLNVNINLFKEVNPELN